MEITVSFKVDPYVYIRDERGGGNLPITASLENGFLSDHRKAAFMER